MIYQLIQVFDNPASGHTGNTSTVVLLDGPMDKAQMQQIAANQLQPATTFLWPAPAAHEYHVRWYAPDAEIGLCGHGSAAAGAFLKNQRADSSNFTLHYRTGSLTVKVDAENTVEITLDAIPVIHEVPIPEAIAKGLKIPLEAMYTTANKHIILAHSEADIRTMQPDYSVLRQSEIFGYAVTAAGSEADFVSRTLVPHVHQLEDPATGSSHAALFPFWAARLGKNDMTAHQLSARGGTFSGKLSDTKVVLEGHFTLLAEGNLY